MQLTRRDLLQGASLIALGASSQAAEAFSNGVSQSSVKIPTGKNLIGLQGGANYSMYHIFANWWKSCTDGQLDITCTGAIAQITASRPTSTVTISVSSPCLIDGNFAETLSPENSSFVLTTTGVLPTDIATGLPLVNGGTYYLKSTDYVLGLPFQFSSTKGGAAINTSGTQSGTHTATGQWTALATTSRPHGLYQTSVNAATNSNGPRNTFWPLTVSNAHPTAFNHSSTPSNYDFVIVSVNKFSYPLGGDPLIPFSGKATLSYSVTESSRPNNGRSAWGLDSASVFFDSNRDPQPNIPLATNITLRKIVQQLNLSAGGWIPFDYSRSSSHPGQPTAAQNAAAGYSPPGAGQNFTLAWTPLGAEKPTIQTSNWQASYDAASNEAKIAFNPKNPPRNVYFGLTANYNSWLAAVAVDGANPVTGTRSFFDPSNIAMLKGGAGKLRFMDWQGQGGYGIGAFSQIPPSTWNYWSTGPQYMSPFQFGMPISPMCSLANETNKHPWLHIPPQFGTTNQYFVDASKSNPCVLGTLWKHPYRTGDVVIPWNVGGSGGGMLRNGALSGPSTGFGQRVNVTSSVASNNFTATQNWAKGQPIVFDLNVNGLQYMNTYFVCNPRSKTFQVSKDYADAIAGIPIALTGSNANTVAASGLNRMYCVVGAVTDYTIELINVNSTDFGAQPAPFAPHNPFTAATYCGNLTTPMDFRKQATEVRLLAEAVKAQLNSHLIPNWQYGNELWNLAFPVSFWLYAQSQNFVNPTTGIKYFAQEDNNRIAGYFYASAMNTVRDVFGGGAHGTRKWEGKLGVWTSVAADTTANFTGINQWILNTKSPLTIPDLVDDLALTCYYNCASGTDNGRSFSAQNCSISATSPALVTLVNGGTLAPHRIWPGMAIEFNTSGTLPTDAATKRPLLRGSGSTTVSFKGHYTDGVLTIETTSADLAGTGLNHVTIGMTIFGACLNSASRGHRQSGVRDAVITSQLTGTPGGIGTYATKGPSQTVGTTNLLGLDVEKDCHVYYSLGVVNNFPFASSVNYFSGSVTGNKLTVSLIDQGELAIGQHIWISLNDQSGVPGQNLPGIPIGTTITGGSGNTWTLSTTSSPAIPVGTRMSSGMPVTCKPGTGSTNQNAVFNGQLSGTTLTVNSMISGQLDVGQYLQLTGSNTLQTIIELGTGRGGTGTYTVSRSIGTVAARTMTSGYHVCASGNATMFQSWIADSIALGPPPIGNGTNPSVYTEFNKQLNYEVVYGPRTSYRIVANCYQWSLHVQRLMSPPGGGPSLVPAIGISFYEGGWGNDLGGRDAYGLAKLTNPAFQEFWPMSVGTAEDANNWTQTVASIARLPGYVNLKDRFTVPSNLRAGFPAQFVDCDGPIVAFSYGAVQYCDYYIGCGYPTWQSLTPPGPKWLAILASN